jgi:hypothetical protein
MSCRFIANPKDSTRTSLDGLGINAASIALCNSINNTNNNNNNNYNNNDDDDEKQK